MSEDYWEIIKYVYEVELNNNPIFQQNHISIDDISKITCSIGQATSVQCKQEGK